MPAFEYPLTMVARLTGLSPQLLRAWEARHQAIAPRRTPNGRRIYTDADLARLQHLRRLTALGFPISRLASLPDSDLEELAARESGASEPVARTVEKGKERRPKEFVADAMRAAGELDGHALIGALEAAEMALGRAAFLERMVAVLVEEIGNAWRSGRLKIAHEHFVTAQLRGYFGPFGRVSRAHPATPQLIVTTPPEQWHELGALLVAAAAQSHGWRVAYLGPSLPVEEIAGAARAYSARAVALSIVFPVDDPQLPRDLARLRRLLPEAAALLIGGRGSHAHSEQLLKLGARHLTRLRDLYPVLDELRSTPG